MTPALARIAYPIASLLVLCSCMTTGKYGDIVHSWEGRTADELVIAWGPPAATARLTTGDTVMEWVDHRVVTAQVPSTTTYSGSVGGAGYSGTASGTTSSVYGKTCKTRFVVSPEGRIKGTSFEGNDCVAL